MAATTLATVQDYISDMRVLLQDTIVVYRYSDAELLVSLNLAFLDGRRLRADLFIDDFWDDDYTAFSAVAATEVPLEKQFRLAFVFGAAAHALARDQEDIQDQRADAFNAVYNSILVGTTLAAITRRKTP